MEEFEFIKRAFIWIKDNCPETYEHLFDPDWREREVESE